MMIKNIIFDVGNVLIGWSPEVSMDILGFTPEEKKSVMKAIFSDWSVWNEEDRGVKSHDELVEFLVSQAPEIGDLIKRFYDGAVLSASPRDYTRGWLKALSAAGYGVYVLSNFGERAQKRAVELGAINFLDLLDGYIFSYMIHEIKPDRAIFDALAEKYGLNLGECVFIDDREDNVEAAKSYGMQGIVFTGYEDACEQLRALGVNF
ncbi:MAG: HAD family phosphatase [Lachnospiraceae bacterium]|nr:HAD family phosphatase [Lachnospiraceae bacterium]